MGKKKGGNGQLQYGLIAQEVEKVLPNIVNTDSEGYKSVNYNELIPLLLKNVQEQDKKIKELQKEIQQLKKENSPGFNALFDVFVRLKSEKTFN
jgi:hypothetical protein